MPRGEFSATGRGNGRTGGTFFPNGVHFQKRDAILEAYFVVCAVDQIQISLAVTWKCSYRDVIAC